MSKPAVSAGSSITKVHCACLIKEHGREARIVKYFRNRAGLEAASGHGYRYRPSVDELASLAYVIVVVIKMSDIYVGDDLKGSRIAKDLSLEVTAGNRRKVRPVEFNLEAANIRGNMKRFNYRFDDGASLKEYTSRRFVEDVWNEIKDCGDMAIPGMSADALRLIINTNTNIRAALGISQDEGGCDIPADALGVDASSAPADDADAALQEHQIGLLAELRVQERRLAERAQAGMAEAEDAPVMSDAAEPHQEEHGRVADQSGSESDLEHDDVLASIGQSLRQQGQCVDLD
jgi:hypothetical protein